MLKGWRVADGDGVMVSVHGWLEDMTTYLFILPKTNKKTKKPRFYCQSGYNILNKLPLKLPLKTNN